MICISLFIYSCFCTQFDFEDQKSFELPEIEDYFLQNPLSFDVDSRGQLYIVDGEARVVFCWDQKGHFLRTIGKPGQGPGEFTFSGHGPALGYINVIDNQLFVFDGLQRKLSVFNSDGKFLRSPALNLQRSRTYYFNALSQNRFMFLIRTLKNDHFVSAIKIINEVGEEKKVLKEMEDTSVSFKMANGRPSSMTFKVFNPELVVAYNTHTETTYMGFSGEPYIEVITEDGTIQRLDTPLIQRDVTEIDKDEFLLSRSGNSRRTPSFVFPEKMPFYRKIFCLDNGDILIFNESDYTHHIQGILLDQKGHLKGKIQTVLGEGGGLLNAGGKLLKFILNAEDEYEFALVSLRQKDAA